MKTSWYKISLIFLFCAATIGTLLRSIAYIPLPLYYKHLVHTHSHVAFQGWVYTLLFLLLTKLFLTEKQIVKRRYPLQFKVTIFMIVGILISFSLQGYALYSIIFSTLFQFLNYWFIYSFFQDIKLQKNTTSIRFIKTGMWLGILSTIVPFGIGVLSAKGLGGTELYNVFVYTFLHLQYNGWFLFIALGLLFKYLENKKINFNSIAANRFYLLLSIASIPTITLSFIGMSFSSYILPIASISAFILLISLVYFILSVYKAFISISQSKNKWFVLFLNTFLASFLLKTIIQSTSIVPGLENLVFHNRPIILAYLHLSLIGVISFLLLALIIELKWLSIVISTKIGAILFFLGFILTELLLTIGGLGISYFYLGLSLGSLLMVIGIILFIFSPKSSI